MFVKIKPRLRAEWIMLRQRFFSNLLFKFDKKKFSFRKVESKVWQPSRKRSVL